MDAGRALDRFTLVEQPPRPPTTFYPISMDGLTQQQQQQQQQQQFRAGQVYGDLCRAQGPTDALSAAYHNRYLASLPALSSTSGSNFPFLGSMFASGPTSPFRAPSAPGIGNCGSNGTNNNNMRQLFWPPTPPPDGYGRYGLNTSLFPLFGSVSPSPSDNGAAAAAYMLSQGLVSRHLTSSSSTSTASHHMIDSHKDQGFFSPGFGLGSPLTPSSQLTTTNPFSHHLIPPPHPLDYNKYPSYCPPAGLNSGTTKDFLTAVTEDSKSQPHHHHPHHHHQSNCQPTVKSENHSPPSTVSMSTSVASVRNAHPSVTTSSKSSRTEKKSSYSPGRPKDIRHPSEDIKPQTKKNQENITKHCHQQSRHLQHYFSQSNIKSCSPFEIDVTYGPTIKPDILSPPIDSSSDSVLPTSPYQDKKKDLSPIDNRCSSCSNDLIEKNDIPKAEEDEGDEDDSNVVVVDSQDKSYQTESSENTVPNDSAPAVMTRTDDAKSDDNSEVLKRAVVPPSSTLVPTPVFPTFGKIDSESSIACPRTDSGTNSIGSKHVTAAVIPTAPKQQHLSSYHYNRADCVNAVVPRQPTSTATVEPDAKGMSPTSSDSQKLTTSALSKIKSETTESNESSLPVIYRQNLSANCCRHYSANLGKNSCTKVKDMIKSIDNSVKQSDNSQSPHIVAESNPILQDTTDNRFQVTSPSSIKLCSVIPEKTVQGKVQAIAVDSKKRVVGPLKTESPVYRFESFDMESSQKPSAVNWSKATVSPYNWQQKDDEQQAINLTVCKKKSESFSPVLSAENGNTDVVDPIDATNVPSAGTNPSKTPLSTGNLMPSTNAAGSCCVSGTGVIGVCHPNVSSIGKGKLFTLGGSVSNFSAVTSVTSQMDVGNDGEVHLSSHSVHSTKSSTYQTLNATAAACLNRAASVTGFQNSKTQLKTERLTPHVRPRSKESDKVLTSNARATTLATLAPKLTKKVGFSKDNKSHTLSTSSSVSSTSIVFPATVNPCIPVGIAIAQQRQDSSTAAGVGKNQLSVPSANSSIVSSASQLNSNGVANDIQQSSEILRDQKPCDVGCPNSAVSSDSTNFLVTQGPTIVSRQWESEAVTRATLPSPWVTHGSIVAPALWIGQGATTAAAYATTAATAAPTSAQPLQPPVSNPVNPLETSPISLPPGGYQLARDPVTGHLFLIPATNIVDRTPVWPSYNSTTGNTLPIQQLVTQQHHTTQFEQVLPQSQERGSNVQLNTRIAYATDSKLLLPTDLNQHSSLLVSEQERVQDCIALSVHQTQIGEGNKDVRAIDSCCDSSGSFKSTEPQAIKTEDKDGSGQVPSLPLASGQTFTFTTFPAPCDPSGFSYVLQSSTVMHLAHTSQTSSIQTESGKRSQGTSPLHQATPSPSPSLPMTSGLSMSENDEEDDDDEPQDSDSDGVACAESTQVKLSQQTHSVTTAVQVDMDFVSFSEVEEDAEEDDERKSILIGNELVEMSDSAIQTENVLSDSGKGDSESELPVDETASESEAPAVIPTIPSPIIDVSVNANNSILKDEVSESKKECEECPSREIIFSEEGEIAPSLPVESKPVMDFIDHHGLDLLVDSIEEFASREKNEAKEENLECTDTSQQQLLPPPQVEVEAPNSEEKSYSISSSYRALDTSCTDGLGLLCALAEQRFFEEALNTDVGNTSKSTSEKTALDCYSFVDEDVSHNVNTKYYSPKKDNCLTKTTSSSPSFQDMLDRPVDAMPSADLRDYEKEMRKRLADLQKKYKEKQRQLAQLKYTTTSDEDNEEDNNVKQKKACRSSSALIRHQKRKKIFTVPRFKQKSVMSGKVSSRFQPRSYKTVSQRLVNNRSSLNNFHKRNLKVSQTKRDTTQQENKSSSHSKQSTLPFKAIEVDAKSRKQNKTENSRSRSQSNDSAKCRTTKKRIESKNLNAKVQHSTQCKASKTSTSISTLPDNNKTMHMKTKVNSTKKITVKQQSKDELQSENVWRKSIADSKSTETSNNVSSSSAKPKHRIPLTAPQNSSSSSSSVNPLKRKVIKCETKRAKKLKVETKSVLSSKREDKRESSFAMKKCKSELERENSKGKDKSKVPFFDEQAWFVRRSERIFLSDARSPAAPQPPPNSTNNTPKKVAAPQATTVQKVEQQPGSKEKKESVKLPSKVSDSKPTIIIKSEKDKGVSSKQIKSKVPPKQKSKLLDSVPPPKKRCISLSSNSSELSISSSDSDSSDESSSSQSDCISNIATNKSTTPKAASVEKPKKPSPDIDAKLHQNSSPKKVLDIVVSKESAKSCILNPLALVDKTRVLILDEGLFYAGHIIGIQAPDVYGIILDGERAHRPHIFSREEILNAAVLEMKPTGTSELPEGRRICAYWSQQYRCLYPGTVTKASSPLPNPSLLHVEFDDGDSGRIPLEDIRMLPPDFPIVSTDPNPLLLLTKRRSRIEKENANEQKSQTQTSVIPKIEKTPQKDSAKLKKKRPESSDEKLSRDSSKCDNRLTSNKQSFNSKERQSSVSKSNDASNGNVSIDKSKNKKLKTKEEGSKKKKDRSRESSLDGQSKGKKRKKHREEHKHHHKHKHHHHKHHHKKHKQTHSAERTEDDSQDSLTTNSPLHDGELMVCTSEKKSDLTVTIKTSPSPHTTHQEHNQGPAAAPLVPLNSQKALSSDSSENEDSSSDLKLKTKTKKKKKVVPEVKPGKRKERVPSVEKSKIAAFLPVRQLWRWSGKGYRRIGAKGKAKKEFYRAIQRGKELLRVGDCAVFLSTGRPHLPYIGRIETMWESWGGKMDVRVKWFYHPEETKSSKKLTLLKGALFQSPHFDENDVQTISHKCEVLSWEDYQKKKDQDKTDAPLFDNNDTYYLAGTYDPITGNLIMEPGVPKIPALSSSEN